MVAESGLTGSERFHESVRAGAAILDREAPGWKDRIAPADLNLGDCDVCVLGQVFRAEAETYAKKEKIGYHLSGFEYGMDDLNLWSEGVELGFAAAEDDYPALTEAWIGYIKGEWS